jgi:N-acetylmuramoyl-L-alanine amidase
MKIIEDLASPNLPNIPNLPMNPEYITIHNTGNRNKGANAEMHARYLNNGAGGRSASWHYTVDDKEIIQHIPDNRNAWAATDGYNGVGNRKSIHIEICENIDGDMKKAEENAIELINFLMIKHNISIMNVVPHKHWYPAKYCPRHILPRWNDFIELIKIGGRAEKVESITTPIPDRNISERGYLKVGDQGDKVKLLQRELIQSGFRIAVDGIFGPNTEKAVRGFQKQAGITEDGLAGKQTFQKLYEDGGVQPIKKVSRKYPGTIFMLKSPYMRGDDVKAIQRAVGVKADGLYGPATERAVRSFQKRKQIPIDGMVGPVTWSKLFY